jgi:hypothetical protein
MNKTWSGFNPERLAVHCHWLLQFLFALLDDRAHPTISRRRLQLTSVLEALHRQPHRQLKIVQSSGMRLWHTLRCLRSEWNEGMCDQALNLVKRDLSGVGLSHQMPDKIKINSRGNFYSCTSIFGSRCNVFQCLQSVQIFPSTSDWNLATNGECLCSELEVRACGRSDLWPGQSKHKIENPVLLCCCDGGYCVWCSWNVIHRKCSFSKAGYWSSLTVTTNTTWHQNTICFIGIQGGRTVYLLNRKWRIL